MRVVYATLEDKYSRSKIKDAGIPEHAVVFVQIGSVLYKITEEKQHLCVSAEGQLAVLPGVINSIRVREEVAR